MCGSHRCSARVSNPPGPADSNATEKLPADTVVFISLNKPNRELYDELMARGVAVSVVGDASAPRFLSYATLEGHTAGATV